MGGRAFSLIELMVVVAVVAVLASIALPAYKNYLIKSRLANVVRMVDGLSSQMIAYSQVKGYYPTPMQLGYASGPGPGAFYGDPNVISPDANFFWMLDYDSTLWGGSAGDGCGKHGVLGFELDTAAFGFPSDVTVFQGECSFWHVDGVIIRECDYIYGASPGVSKTDKMIAGWINGNTGSSWDLSKLPVLHSPYIAQATCMNH